MQAVPVEEWGPFLPDTVPCVRMVSRAVHACFDSVFDLEERCAAELASGSTCDRSRVDAESTAAARRMQTVLTSVCEAGQLTELGYFGFADATLDLRNACLDQARAAVAAAYAPSRVVLAAPATAECMEASAAYSRRIIRFVLKRATPVMERMATLAFQPPEKTAMTLQLGRELAATRARWIEGLSAACPQFVNVYGRSAESFARTMKQRADCVLSKTYVNSAVSCPLQECGNGIPEEGESCDDGNQNDLDACPNDCGVDG